MTAIGDANPHRPAAPGHQFNAGLGAGVSIILDSSVAIPFRGPTKEDGSREAEDVSALRR